MVNTQNGWSDYTSKVGESMGYGSNNDKEEYKGEEYYTNGQRLHIGGDGRPYVFFNGRYVPATRATTPTDPTDYFKRFSNADTAYALSKLQSKYGNSKGKVVRYRGNYYISDGTSWSPYSWGTYTNNGTRFGEASV